MEAGCYVCISKWLADVFRSMPGYVCALSQKLDVTNLRLSLPLTAWAINCLSSLERKSVGAFVQWTWQQIGDGWSFRPGHGPLMLTKGTLLSSYGSVIEARCPMWYKTFIQYQCRDYSHHWDPCLHGSFKHGDRIARNLRWALGEQLDLQMLLKSLILNATAFPDDLLRTYSWFYRA